MKKLHRPDLYGWSAFAERPNIDFNSLLWVRPDGNVIVDPLALTPHDRAHLDALGGARWIVLTNSDHVRGAEALAKELGAKVAGPAAEQGDFPIACDRWLRDGDELAPGLRVLELQGSKTPGELALILDERTLVTGDLIRSHRANALMLLMPEQGLSSLEQAKTSVQRLAAMGPFDAILLGDGFSIYRHGHELLAELARSLAA